MVGDLGAQAREVHATAREARDFWFALPREKRFAKDDALDADICKRFGALRNRLLATGADGWRDDPATLLAAIIVLDQFSRNLHRGTSGAFAADGVALGLTMLALERGWEEGYSAEERSFLYMPLMHAEDPAAQRLSVDRFATLAEEEHLRFALEHADVIGRYGRFPTRNAALGRRSTPAEEAYLSQPDVGW
jgi:uncharacterized protein (DUF924 family)